MAAVHDALHDVIRDLDLVVYRLEREPDGSSERRHLERRAIRNELERLRERLEDLTRLL
jgi:hypothetical protein